MVGVRKKSEEEEDRIWIPGCKCGWGLWLVVGGMRSGCGKEAAGETWYVSSTVGVAKQEKSSTLAGSSLTAFG